MLFFVDKDDEETRGKVSGQQYAEYSTDKATFVIVPKPEPVKALDSGKAEKGPAITGVGRGDKAKAESASEAKSPVPVSKLEAADLWKAYGVSKAGTMILADWYGNKQATYASVPKHGVMTRAIDGVPATVTQTKAKIDSEVTKLEAQLEKGNDVAAVKAAMKIFKMDVVGFDGVTKTVEKYQGIVARGRDRLKALEADGDAVGLRKLRADYRGSDIDSEIADAITRVSTKA